MAWTDPRTWVTDELVTAAMMNAHVRDNFGASGPHLSARKTADQSQGSGSFADDTHLTLAMAANDVWLVDVFLGISSASSIALSWKFPSGNIFLTGVGTATFTWTDTSSPAGNQVAAAGQMFRVSGLVRNSSTPGNFLPYWAGSGGTATIVANSALYAVKLA